MSSEGGAAVIAVPAALILAPAAIAAGLAIGGVILVAEGAMWCGKQLHGRYVARCESWVTGEQLARDSGSVIPLENFLATMRQGIVQGSVDYPSASFVPGAEATSRFREALQQAMAAATSEPGLLAAAASASQPGAEQTELARERERLAVEIAVAQRQGLESAAIATAQEQAQSGLLEQVVAAREGLKHAWAKVTDTERQRTRQRELAVIQLAVVAGTSAGLKELASQGRLVMTPEQAAQLRVVDDSVEHARQRLATSPDRALQDAEELRSKVEQIERAVTLSAHAARQQRSQVGAQVAHLQGRINALRSLAQEAGRYEYAPKAEVAEWLKQIDRAEASLTGQSVDLQAVTRATNEIETTLFAVIDSRPQRALGEQIAQVMAEQGFHRGVNNDQVPEVVDLADGEYLVMGLRNDAEPGRGRDDKVVTFTLTADGAMKYDFAGYVGDACHKDAQAIFAGLRRRGIVIVDERWQPTEGAELTYSEAEISAPFPAIATNKDQALITAAVVSVLEKMAGANGEVRVHSIAAQVHISLSASGLGYYQVSVESTGEVTDATHAGESPHADPMAPLRPALAKPHKGRKADNTGSVDEEQGIFSDTRSQLA